MKKPNLYYCAGGNKLKAELAIKYGFLYGSQMPHTVYYKPEFIDQNWLKPQKEKYINLIKQHNPQIATVLDFERKEQYSEIIDWCYQISDFVKDAIIIIPKVNGIIEKLPKQINGKSIRLGYSVPTKYAGTTVPLDEFQNWPIHLLGGSPKKQKQLFDDNRLNVISCDGNYINKLSNMGIAIFGNKHLTTKQIFGDKVDSAVYVSFEISLMNVRAIWNECKYAFRMAVIDDLAKIKELADKNKQYLGFLQRGKIEDGINKKKLLVVFDENKLIGFVIFNPTKRGVNSGYTVIYDICVDQHYRSENIGKTFVDILPKPIRLKSTIDNEIANLFYAKNGFEIISIENGKNRKLNLWQLQ